MKRISTKDGALMRYLRNVPASTSLEVIASDLTGWNYVSRTGRQLTASHVSIILRQIGRRRMKKCAKPNYKGKNWMSFK